MAVLLSVLKILGIILLCILGLLVILILLLLFAPVSYRITGESEEGQLALKVRGAWCLFLLRFLFCMEHGEQHAAVRLAGIKIWKYPAGSKVKKQSRKKKKAKKAKDKGVPKETKDTKEAKDTKGIDIEDIKKETVPEKDVLKEEPVNRKKRFRLFHKIKKTIQNICKKIKAIPQKLKHIAGKISKIKQWIQDEQNRNAVRCALGEAISLLKKYGPKHIKADVAYGMEDPAMTGQILAVLSILPFLYYDKVSIMPDFEAEQFYVRGSWDIRGHIQLIHLLTMAVRIYKNPDVKHFIKQF